MVQGKNSFHTHANRKKNRRKNYNIKEENIFKSSKAFLVCNNTKHSVYLLKIKR